MISEHQQETSIQNESWACATPRTEPPVGGFSSLPKNSQGAAPLSFRESLPTPQHGSPTPAEISPIDSEPNRFRILGNQNRGADSGERGLRPIRAGCDLRTYEAAGLPGSSDRWGYLLPGQRQRSACEVRIPRGLGGKRRRGSRRSGRRSLLQRSDGCLWQLPM
jgi:hypothetical protein